MSTIALVGGDEFSPNCQDMDRALLERLGPHRTVAILPTAAAHENPRLAGENGTRYFRRLGAQAETFLITHRRSANDRASIGPLGDFGLIYFTGGDPVHLLETLRDSALWHALLAALEQGAILAGSSAGAMVMGGQLWSPGAGWVPGLAFLPQVAVLPHHATMAVRWDSAKMAAALPPGVTLIGLDVATALVFPERSVLGAGSVTVYASNGPAVYRAGDTAVALGQDRSPKVQGP